MMRCFKVIVQKHLEGYVAYSMGLKGVAIGESETYEDVLTDVRTAIRFHIETFGPEALAAESPILDAFIAEATVPV